MALSTTARFGDAIADYSLAALAGGLLVGLLSILLVFVFPPLAAMTQFLAIGGAFLGVLIYLVMNIRGDGHELETGLEVFAAITPFLISPILGILVGVLLKYLG